MAAVTEIADLLSERTRRRGAEPLITYYNVTDRDGAPSGAGERTELSAVSLRNWVDKTSNLLVDELLVEPGDRVALPLAREAPGHWVTFVWELALWQVGATVDVAGPSGSEALVIAGREWEPYAEARELVACSLHPLGLGFAEPLPAGVLDYGIEVRAQPDQFLGLPASTDLPAWTDGHRTLSQADLVAIDAAPGRRLVLPTSAWATCRDGLLSALVSGGSTVVVVGADHDQLGRIVTSERVTVTAAG